MSRGRRFIIKKTDRLTGLQPDKLVYFTPSFWAKVTEHWLDAVRRLKLF